MRDRRAAAVLLLAAAAGCGRCGREAAAPPERFVAADAPLALLLPRVRAAQEQAAALARTAVTFPAAADLAEALAAAREQLGLDPLDPAALSGAGVDPARGLAVARGRDGALVLVLPAGDPARLEATVARLARDRAGAGRRSAAREGGVEVVTFAPAAGPPALALAFAAGDALLAAGPGAAARVAAAASLPEPASLARSAAFARARAAVGGDPAFLLFAPPGSPLLAGWPALREGAAAGVSGGATRLAVAAALLAAPERLASWRAALDPGAPAGPAPALPGDAFLVGRLAGDPAPLVRRALALAPGAGAALARAGLDPERDLLGALAPGATGALALAPTFDVATVSRGGAGALAADPFRLTHLAAALAVKDEAQARAALERLARAAPALGLTASARAVAGRPAWRFARGPLALDVALDGRRLLLAGGPGRLEQLLAGPGEAAYAPPTAAARAALDGRASGAVLDLGRLVAAFRALPPTAYGTGPDAFVMRSLADRVVDPAARLAAASARAEVGPDAARLELVVEARPPEEAR